MENRKITDKKEAIELLELAKSFNNAIILHGMPNVAYFSDKMLSDELLADKDVAIMLVKQFHHNYEFISEDLKKDKEIGRIYLDIEPRDFQNLHPELRDDFELSKMAVDKWIINLSFVSDRLKDNDEFMRPIIEKDDFRLRYASKRLQEQISKEKEENIGWNVKKDKQQELER
ncbi:DUF4116 domain-containing protein [Streptobacillus moniliformis]|uniref:DUF4116 domain-containing protein n=1 Tax=Streptobacillus moniliformis TaxID=34105 RepID=UPI0007E41E95|nr:DUF4116 domain-containing protein [Streptobacillus moniliformis]